MTFLRPMLLCLALPVLFISSTPSIFAQSGVKQEASAKLTLVSNGKSDYVIIVGKDASASEKFAAQELQSHIEQISGAKLPIREQSNDMPKKAIVLGLGASPVKLDAKGLGVDGYIIETNGDRLIIAGSAKRGTLYGVYTFLESLGVRWWYPGETTIPKKKTITIPSIKLREVPKLEYRDMMFYENYRHPLWMARNKVNGMAWSDNVPEKLGGRYKFVGNLVHSYDSLLKKSGHKITDDMKALVKGKRTSAQPCLSNEKTVAAMVDGVLKAFKENPDARFVVVGQQDNHNYCRCPKCAAIDKQEDIHNGKEIQIGSRRGHPHSGQVIRFANQVAEEVEKRRPGSCITTAAYEWSRAPTKTIKPRDNVYITLCSIECDFAHPLATSNNPRNKHFREDIEGWGKIANKIFIWHYVGNRDHYLQPNAELETLVPNIKFFADNKCAGVFNQGTHHGTATDMTMLKQWVLAKAMWDPDAADSLKLIEEFCRGYYGPAGDDILRYIDIIHAAGRKSDFYNGRRVELDAPYLRADVIADAEAALRQAEAKVPEDSDYGRRVRHAHMGVWYVLAKRGPGSHTWKTVEAKVGKLKPTDVSKNLARVVKESKVNKILDNFSVTPWIQWVEQYMAETEKNGAPPIPPELKGVDPKTYKLIQVNQFDANPKWWKPVEGASDGYAALVEIRSSFYYNKRLIPGEDYQPGRTYMLNVRAKGKLPDNVKDDVIVWKYGANGVKGKKRYVNVTPKELSNDEWRVYQIGPFTAQKDTDYSFWTCNQNLSRGNGAYVDCIWLSEVKK